MKFHAWNIVQVGEFLCREWETNSGLTDKLTELNSVVCMHTMSTNTIFIGHKVIPYWDILHFFMQCMGRAVAHKSWSIL